MEGVRRRCGFLNGIDVDSTGTRGGLCLAWHGDINVGLQSYSKSHIDVEIEDPNLVNKWRFTGFYGSLYSNDKKETWNLMRHLRNGGELSWMVCGISMRFYMALKNKKVWHVRRGERKIFASIWGSLSGDLLSKLDGLKRGLKKWAIRIQHNKKGMKEALTTKLQKLLENERDDEILSELIDTKIQLNFEIEKDEQYWEQRVWVNWLKNGDKNTIFFPKQATQKRQRNFIGRLQEDDGGETKETSEMESIAK
ncbi:hypothetical protein J1N35_028321 [Gossypium stocksii]|uniref:Uncharacterized protein n=1 Tax=Gossypium stocksii TaxID=47602 RepID=A0A9D3UXP2_9ROSI|nr:hypothetical protein J1N35_028321 [Gossypium stocksii]